MARHTRETILLCEAAGYANILVETVGVGQSETAVRSMTDFFLLLMIAGAGDGLQGIKRGILEMVDAVAVNKADGDNVARAERTRAEYAGALHLFPASTDGWTPRVTTCSALYGESVPALWELVLEHGDLLGANGAFLERRRRQALDWMRELVSLSVQERFRQHPLVSSRLPDIEHAVLDGQVTSFAAARELVQLFFT